MNAESKLAEERKRQPAAPRNRSVLLVGDGVPLAADHRTLRQARLLREAGLAVTLVGPLGDGPLSLEGVRVIHETPSLPAGGGEAELRAAAQREGARLARLVAGAILSGPGCALVSIARPAETGLLAARVARFLHKLVLVDYRVPGPEALLERGAPTESSAHRAALRAEHQFLARAELVLCPSPAIEHLVAQRGGLPRERVVLLRDASPAAAPASDLPKGASWRKGRKHLAVFAGALTRYAGVDLFVRAARRIVYGLDYSNIQFVIAGDGPHRRAIEDLIVAEGLKDYVTVTGGEDSDLVAGLIAAADVAIDPLPASPLGRVLASPVLDDYVARGVPAVAFDRGEAAHHPPDAVYLVRETDIPGLAQAILRMIETAPARKPAASPAVLYWRGDASPVYASLVQRVLANHLPAPMQDSMAAI